MNKIMNSPHMLRHRALVVCCAMAVIFPLLAVAAAIDAQTGQPAPPTRYRTFLFGVDYYPEHWPEAMWEQDARRMRDCGVQAVRIGEFSWALMEPREGTFDFSLFDRAIAVLRSEPPGARFRRAIEGR